MTDKWKLAKQAEEKQKKQRNFTVPEDDTDIDIDGAIKGFMEMRNELAQKLSIDIADTMCNNFYKQSKLTLVEAMVSEPDIAKQAVKQLYDHLTEESERVRKKHDFPISHNITGFDTFDEFYDNFHGFILKVNDHSDDMDDIARFASKHTEMLNDEQLFLYIALHLVHEHKRRRIWKGRFITLECGHAVCDDVNINFCSTCGKAVTKGFATAPK